MLAIWTSDFMTKVCSCGNPFRDLDNRCLRCNGNISESRAGKLDFYREPKDIASCQCPPSILLATGTRLTTIEGVFLCNSCNMITSELHELISVVEPQIESQIAEQPQAQNVPISNRTASQNLQVVESLLSQLAQTKKYKRAISGGEFAAFSILGTNDWEDYASLAIDALQLLTLAQINENLEAITQKLGAGKASASSNSSNVSTPNTSTGNLGSTTTNSALAGGAAGAVTGMTAAQMAALKRAQKLAQQEIEEQKTEEEPEFDAGNMDF